MSNVKGTVETSPRSTEFSISSEALAAYPSLRHCSTTRDFAQHGQSRLHELRRVQEHLGAPESFLVYAEQRHTNNVEVVTKEIIEKYREQRHWQPAQTDALVCALPDVTMAIQTADCAPVFLFDPENRIIGMAHAGWKGTLARVAMRTVELMQSIGASPKSIIAWIGPTAGKCCYEVSDELVEAFQTEFRAMPPELIANGRFLDLVSINCAQMIDAGVSTDNIHRSDICTIHNHDRFYSYRADNGPTGRIISAMVMPENP